MAETAPPVGVLLVNLGTPDSPSPRDVRRYLREFLSDPRVIDLPAVARFLLLELVILPFRPRRSAEAYRAIWTEEGSPLLVHGQALGDAVASLLGDGFRVELAMRYGRPSIAQAMSRLRESGATSIVALPLFPQYSAAASGSARARILEEAARHWDVPSIHVLGDWYAEPEFGAVWSEVAGPALSGFQADHVLFSYHGLPERQVRKSDRSGRTCLASDDCCARIGPHNAGCYRAQCFATTRILVDALGLDPARTTTSFQSRLGRDPWIAPYTDHVLGELARSGVKRLAVLSPAFAADCLETLEELGLRGREQWLAEGGEELLLVPCPNAHPAFARAVAGWIRRAAGAG
ncbi:MAG: ferrochelatase [Myxococcota bacterium]